MEFVLFILVLASILFLRWVFLSGDGTIGYPKEERQPEWTPIPGASFVSENEMRWGCAFAPRCPRCGSYNTEELDAEIETHLLMPTRCHIIYGCKYCGFRFRPYE